MNKKILMLAAAGLSIMMLAGCGESEQYGYEDAEIYTLNKCDASDETLVDVGVGGPWSYDDEYSIDEEDMYLDHEDGGFIYISNEAYEPLYSHASAYASEESVDSESLEYLDDNGYSDFDYDFNVIGTAFGGSDLILVEEAYTFDDGSSKTDIEDTYLLIRYSDDGYIEFLTVDFYGMDIDGWTNDDYVELARNLFGK